MNILYLDSKHLSFDFAMIADPKVSKLPKNFYDATLVDFETAYQEAVIQILLVDHQENIGIPLSGVGVVDTRGGWL